MANNNFDDFESFGKNYNKNKDNIRKFDDGDRKIEVYRLGANKQGSSDNDYYKDDNTVGGVYYYKAWELDNMFNAVVISKIDNIISKYNLGGYLYVDEKGQRTSGYTYILNGFKYAVWQEAKKRYGNFDLDIRLFRFCLKVVGESYFKRPDLEDRVVNGSALKRMQNQTDNDVLATVALDMTDNKSLDFDSLPIDAKKKGLLKTYFEAVKDNNEEWRDSCRRNLEKLGINPDDYINKKW